MHDRFHTRMARVFLTFALAGGIATLVLVFGTRDLESYEDAFVSLNRGTAMQTIGVFGQPVYTLALGLGVRLPLHGNLGASPAAALAPYLPIPATYWLLVAFAVAAAVMLAWHALEPVSGRLVAWLAMVLLFCSVPIVNYTIVDDWPQTAVTYCAFVGCVFAPHALLHLLQRGASGAARGVAIVGSAASVWGLVALAHPGYWPLLATSLVLTAALALGRSEHPFQARGVVLAAIGAASVLAVLAQVPDLLREINVATGAPIRRYVDGTNGSLTVNAFPFGGIEARSPFALLPLALVSLAVGVTWAAAHRRVLIVGSALMALLLAVVAAVVSPGESTFAPSTAWGFRDPALAFAVFAAAGAAEAVRRLPGGRRAVRAAAVMLAIAALQGPASAAVLALTEVAEDGNRWRWNQDATPPAERVTRRGFPPDGLEQGRRLALWPEVRQEIRDRRRSSTDFADAGYLVVTASTKQRTMRRIVEPNDLLFNQQIEMAPQALCDAEVVHFLQLRYILLPDGVDCGPWMRLPGVRVDDWLGVGVAPDGDVRVRTIDSERLSQQLRAEPALSATSLLPSALVPLADSSIEFGPRGVDVRLPDRPVAPGRILMVPVAYDPAWRTSSGRVENVGGLVAIAGATASQVRLEFVPDTVATLRALSAAAAQILAVVGFIALAWRP